MKLEEKAKKLAEIEIQTQSELLKIDLKTGTPIFILGRNGTGKSALVNRISAQLSGKAVYMPGSRPSYFDGESLSMTPASRREFTKNLKYYDSQLDTRWKSDIGTSRNEKAIHDLLAAETQYKIDAANQIKFEGADSLAIARLQADNSPLDIVNSLLAQANLPVQLEVSNAELKAKQASSLYYSYARMSDGERSALVFAAEVVAAEPGMIFLIDEPELHLHPSIVISLVKALILARPDCGFVICTHQLELPTDIQGGNLILVRGSSWSDDNITAWDIDVIDNTEQIPEWLWVDLVGSRRKILFIEGNNKTSLDQPLYSLLFEKISVRPRGSCKEVIKAVEGLRAVKKTHRAEAFGLIDNDGMSDELIRKFESNGIYPLPIFSVESLIYSEEAQEAIAIQQAEALGIPYQEMLEAAKIDAIRSLNRHDVKEYLASRLAERQIRDQLLSAIPTRQQLIDQTTNDLKVTIDSPYPGELVRLAGLIDSSSLHEIISRYPVRETGVLNAVAKGLRFNSRDDYERAVLQRIGADSRLRDRLKQKLGNLAVQLE